MVWQRWPLALLFLTVLAGPAFPAQADGPMHEDDLLVLPLGMPFAADQVALRPYDIRSGSLQAADPAPLGHYRGALVHGEGTVHLILRGASSLGVLATVDGTQWIHVVDGAIVAFDLDALGLEEAPYGEDGIAAPEDPREPARPEPLSNPNQDGVLQLDIELDEAIVDMLGYDRARGYALDVMFLAEGIYYAQFRSDFVIGSVWSWPNGDPYGDLTGSALLRAIRDEWEAFLPTTSDDRELLHTFTGRAQPSANGYAYLGQLETSWSYGWHKLRSDYYRFSAIDLPHPLEVITTAHEIGHNYDGRHEYALPKPDGLLDPLYRDQCVTTKYGTILYPCGAPARAPRFSEASAGRPQLDQFDILEDGGNAWRMRAYSEDRI